MSYKDFLSLFVGKTSDELISEVVLANENKIKKGSEIGWVLSPTMPIPEYYKIVAMDDISRGFYDYYENNFSAVINYVESKSSLLNKFLRSMVMEAIWAYKEDKLLICIPALFAVIEGALVHISNSGNKEKTRYWYGANNAARESGSGQIALPLLTLSHFLACTFQPSKFNEGPLAIINRHWSQHGRYESSPPKESVMQLLSAVAVILWVFELKNNA
ncbi:hypothetical protein [Simiduia aestuariiviva]|uniref:Uncharacterized protein n=1 Tax=Simiduia aestuariiviva TaxID=1510459 RepID=A0A839UQ35_9GAMM|nr:hypothetical protein [Simiduia aestuariiviva]MBB3169962.1 hypothetical protein [Simiduia aestuariiviva]